MSFDLYYCGPSGTRIDVSRLQRYMNKMEHVTESQSDDGSLIQFDYNNETTGVYCLFDASTEIETEDEPLLPDGRVSSGLSVSINFLRPHFFALEFNAHHLDHG